MYLTDRYPVSFFTYFGYKTSLITTTGDTPNFQLLDKITAVEEVVSRNKSESFGW